MRLSHALEPYAATISEHIDLNRISVASIVINQVFSMHASLTAHTSTLVSMLILHTHLHTFLDCFHWIRFRSRNVSSNSACLHWQKKPDSAGYIEDIRFICITS